MEDTLQSDENSLLAKELGRLLEDHNGIDTVVLDMRSLDFWTDFFIIVTATSDTHLSGLQRHVKDFVQEKGLEILRRSRRPETGLEQRSEEWCLLDLGNIVVHLMTAKTRDFFELERLWSSAPIIPHSSKSS